MSRPSRTLAATVTCALIALIVVPIRMTAAAAQESPARPAPTTAAAAPRWPNSDQRLNFSAALTPRMVRLTTPENVAAAAPSVIWSAYSDPKTDGPRGFENLSRFVKNEPRRPLVGRYFSACSVREQTRFDPPETAPIELLRDDRLPNTFGNEAGRRLIDIRKPDVRVRLAKHFVETAGSDADFLALDNFTVEYFTPAGLEAAEWDAAQYALLAEIRTLSRAAGVRVVPNVSSRPEKTWPRLIPLVDGLLFEMPVHPNAQKAPDVLQAELAAYRAALDAGLFVGLIPDAKSVGLVAATAMLIREPGDALFVSPRDSVPTAAGWMEWPERWGPAVGRYVRDGSRFSREFQRVSLNVDFASGSIAVTPK